MKKLILAAAFTLLSAPAFATFLTLSPSVTDAVNGDIVSLDLIVGDLSDGGAPSIGAFDIDIGFDDSALDFAGVTYGSMLGDMLTESITDTASSNGLVGLLEVSFLSIADLDALQGESFVLATLDFLVEDLAVGASTLVSFGDTLLADAFGLALGVDMMMNAVIQNPNPQTVPEPPVLALCAMGVVLMRLARKRCA
ncbi:MAG: cohesin domain-containing protein [Gammaproteobacteria bacterium]